MSDETAQTDDITLDEPGLTVTELDGVQRYTYDRRAMSGVNFMERVALMLSRAQHGGRDGPPITVTFTDDGNPIYLQRGSQLRGRLLETNPRTLRMELPGRSHPVDFYWEELATCQFVSRLPSVD